MRFVMIAAIGLCTLTATTDKLHLAKSDSQRGFRFLLPMQSEAAAQQSTTTIRLRATLAGHRHEIDRIAFSPDGETIATESNRDGTVRLWNTQSGSLKVAQSATDGRPDWYPKQQLSSESPLPSLFSGRLKDAVARGARPLIASPDRQLILTQTPVDPKNPALAGVVLDVWELAKGNLRITFGELPFVIEAYWSANGDKIVVVGYGRTQTRLLDVPTVVVTKLPYRGCVTDAVFGSGGCEPFVFSLDARLLVKQNRPLKLLDSGTGGLIGELSDAIPPAIFSPTDKHTLITRGKDKKTALLWEVELTDASLPTREGR